MITKDFFVKKNGGYEKIGIQSILYFQSQGNYCIIKTSSDHYLIRQSLAKLNTLFSSEQFIRVHKSYMVQHSQIDLIDPKRSILRIKGREIPIGRKYKADLIGSLEILQ